MNVQRLQSRMRRAIVLGGSIAGLLAARVLAEHADEVVIIERDDIGQINDRLRYGVPQGNQFHVLRHLGRLQLERWFPGIGKAAIAGGAQLSELRGANNRFYNGKPVPRSPGPAAHAILATRPYLEALIRKNTFAEPVVNSTPGRAQGLIFSGNRVVGVRYRPIHSNSSDVITGDLVVDATGRSSRIAGWLVSEGWEAAPLRRKAININYASLMFKREEQVSAVKYVASNIEVPGQAYRGFAVMAVEGGRWLMVHIESGLDHVIDMNEYVNRTRVHPPVFADITTRAIPMGEIVKYHLADSRRRDYCQVRRFPSGLVIAGDAVASFNPFHGQGMTCAALHASALSAYLRSNPSLTEPAVNYFEQVQHITDVSWQTSSFANS
jgi:2-polyprenyl-6-methoxyphenol hydroxylase-like FAD-dependent oxidoreductase